MILRNCVKREKSLKNSPGRCLHTPLPLLFEGRPSGLPMGEKGTGNKAMLFDHGYLPSSNIHMSLRRVAIINYYISLS